MTEWPVERDDHSFQPLPETWLDHPHATDSETVGPRCLAVSCEVQGGRMLSVRYAHLVFGNVIETVGGAAAIPNGDGYAPVGLVDGTGWPRSFVPSPGEPKGDDVGDEPAAPGETVYATPSEPEGEVTTENVPLPGDRPSVEGQSTFADWEWSP